MAIVKDFITRYGVIIQGNNAVSSSTGQIGALQLDGGAAIAKNLIVGDGATIWGSSNIKGGLLVNGITTITNSVTVNALTVLGQFTASQISITGGTELSSLKVSNWTTLTNLTVLNNASIGGTLSASTATFSGPVTITGTNSLTVGTGATTLGGNLAVLGTGTTTLGGNLTVSSTDVATTTPSGSLVLGGGAFIGKNLIVSSTSSNTGTNTSNAVYVAGGAWIDKNLTVVGTALFESDVIFSGTATYVYSTNTYITDNIINLHVPEGGINANWTFDDGKDIGLKFHLYANSTDTHAALVLANDTKYLEWYDSGAEGQNVFNGASYGTFKTGGIRLTDTSNASSTQTGALQVAGGIAAKNIYAGDYISAQSLIARNLTQSRVVVAGLNGTLIDDAELTYNTATNILNGTITSAITATNVSAGTAGQLLYQSSVGITSFVEAGSPGLILQSNGTSAPTWIPLSGTTSGNATTATYLAGGTPGQIPYQVSTGTTGFVGPGIAGQFLQSNGASGPVYVNTGNIYVGAALKANAVVGGTSGQLLYQSSADTTSFVSTGTVGDILVSNGSSAPTYQNTLTLAGVVTSTNKTSGTLVVGGGVGIGQNLYVGGKTIVENTENSSSTSSGSIQTLGGVGIAKSLTVGESINVGSAVAGSVVPAIYSNNILLASYTSPTITTTATVNLDVFDGSIYRTAKYTVQIVDGSSIYAADILVTHNGTNAYISEYGIIANNGQLGNFDVSYAGGAGSVTLNFVPTTVSSMTIKVVRFGITA